MTTSLIQDAAALVAASVRTVQGESITLRTSAGSIAAEISDALVSLDPPAVGEMGDGPGTHTGRLRLADTHRAAALTAYTATVREATWQIVHIGETLGGLFRVELQRDEVTRSNLFDLSGQQAVFHGE